MAPQGLAGAQVREPSVAEGLLLIAGMFGVHPTLRGYVAVAFYLSAAVGVFGVVFLIMGLTRGEGAHPDWPFVIFGVIAIVSALAGTTLVPRHYRTATRIVETVEPIAQRILIERVSDSDSTSLYATPLDGDSDAKKRSRRYALVLPIWNVESLLNEPVSVSAYVNPANHRPVAFRTPKGILWCIPSWQGQA